MNNRQTITVDWFDELEGIGEGKTSDGQIIFLNSHNIVPEDSFLTLQPGEIVICEVNKNMNNLYASQIIRKTSKRTKSEKTSLLEPWPLEPSSPNVRSLE